MKHSEAGRFSYLPAKFARVTVGTTIKWSKLAESLLFFDLISVVFTVSVIKDRYKTELCRAFQEAGHCKYGEKCQFAHGRQDLRSVNRHPKYKTDKCRSFHATGLCQYGARCHFIHHPSEANMAPPAAMMSSSAAAAAAAARTRSVSLCTFPPTAVTVPRNILGQQTFEVGSCGNSVNDFSSYSSSPASMSPGLNRSFISGEDSFFGSGETSSFSIILQSFLFSFGNYLLFSLNSGKIINMKNCLKGSLLDVVDFSLGVIYFVIFLLVLAVASNFLFDFFLNF
jgi:butyrate response factor